MIINTETRRNIIPNWRGYIQTVHNGEMSYDYGLQNTSQLLIPLNKYITNWESHKTIPYASELLSAAVISGGEHIPQVIDASRFIISHIDESSKLLVKIANDVLGYSDSNVVGSHSTLEDNLEYIREEGEHTINNIKILKQDKDYYCYNPIVYCELSRYYTILGQLDKAKLMIEIALHLAPHHRYINRSAARFFLHIGDMDKARYIIAHNPNLPMDPWLIASEIGISTLMGRNSKYIKKGISIINSNKFSSFNISELCSAIGSMEYNNGNLKKCKTFLNQSLQQPNDNSLAQARWLETRETGLSFNVKTKIQLNTPYEADSLSAFLNNDYPKALLSALKWSNDMPFSKRPFQCAAHIACLFLKDYPTAKSVLLYKLKVLPNDVQLLNDLAYICALSNDIDEATQYLSKAMSLTDIKHSDIVCLTATAGLIEYRKGDIASGRSLYKKAIDYAKHQCPNTDIDKIATLNYFREDGLATSSFDNCIYNQILNMPDVSRDVIQLKKDALNAVLLKTNA